MMGVDINLQLGQINIYLLQLSTDCWFTFPAYKKDSEPAAPVRTLLLERSRVKPSCIQQQAPIGIPSSSQSLSIVILSQIGNDNPQDDGMIDRMTICSICSMVVPYVPYGQSEEISVVLSFPSSLDLSHPVHAIQMGPARNFYPILYRQLIIPRSHPRSPCFITGFISPNYGHIHEKKHPETEVYLADLAYRPRVS